MAFDTITELHFPSINDENEPADIYALGVDSAGKVWVSTSMPIHVVTCDDAGGIVMNEYGKDRQIHQASATGDRGEVVSWVESNSEMWGATYAAKNRYTEFASTLAHYSPVGMIAGWRAKGRTADGTTIYWGNHDTVNDDLGQIMEVDATDGTVTIHDDVINQVPMVLEYNSTDSRLYAAGSAEGISGADTGCTFYSIDPSDMSIDWSYALAGTRPLGMVAHSSTEYLVLCHLASDKVARMVLINTTNENRTWTEIQTGVKVNARARNSLVKHSGTYYYLADDGVYSFNPTTKASTKEEGFTATQIAGMVSSSTLGLVFAYDNKLCRWQP